MIRATLLAAFAVSSAAHAMQIASPLLSERGAVRYVMHQEHPESWSLNVWSGVYSKESHKAFRASGNKTQELSALFFNKSDFRAREMHPGATMPLNSENYNPYAQVSQLSPRVEYQEKGSILGARWDIPVFEEQGRLFIRAVAPFREIQLQRNDEAIPAGVQAQNLVAETIFQDAKTNGANPVVVTGYAWRLDLLEALVNNNNDRQSIVQWDGTPPSASGTDRSHMNLGPSQNIRQGDSAAFLEAAPYSYLAPAALATLPASFLVSPEGIIPSQSISYLATLQSGDIAATLGILQTAPQDRGATRYYIPTAGTNLYTGMSEAAATSIPDALNRANTKATLWITPNSLLDGNFNGAAWKAVIAQTNASLAAYGQNQYEWLLERGYEFETKKRTGLGDVDIDLGYEHRFSNELVGELALGVRLPMSGKTKYTGNPYTPLLGNNGHLEIKAEGMIAWQPYEWMNLKADTYYSWVVKATEQKMATFKGSTLRNIGPRADADVSWGYFVFRLDATFFHLQDKNLSGVVGYELYAKSRDHVAYKNSSMTSWLGRAWVAGAQDANGTTGGSFVANPQLLDNAAASLNTNRVSHKIRTETSWRPNDYIEFFGGAAFTIAGVNAPVETDFHLGMNVNF